MTIEKNDPRLTAFVLGELPEDEAAEIRSALDADVELREEVEAIRKTVAEIEDFMKNEPLPGELPGETKISTPGVIDTPEKAEEIKKRRFPLTIVELLVVVSIIGMLAGLLLPAKNAARNAAKHLEYRSDSMRLDSPDTEVPAAENTPIDDLRYFDQDESAVKSDRFGRPGKVAQLGRPLQEPPASPPVVGGVPTESVPSSGSGGAIYSGGTIVGQGELRKSGVERLERHEVLAESLMQAESSFIPVPESSQSTMSSGMAAGRRPARGMGGMKGKPAFGPTLGVSSIPVPVSPYRRHEMENDQSVTMMVTPKIIVQEEEEEYFADTPADPYNSASDEAYKNFVENDFLRPQKAPFSTFSIDVDTAAYTTMRRYINQGRRPPAASVRLEEYVNFFKYDYAQPKDGKPFATHVDVATCPWEPKHLLARIGIKGKEYTVDERPPLNLVFLIDTSGSMESSNRLPLVQRGLTELVEMLQPKDRVAIVTYAGSSKLALPSVSGQEKQAILDSINALNASGSTAGASGIKTAYETARKYYNKNAQNRVILCTDGDFNVGTTDNKTLEQMIGEEAKSGVFLTILGFGMGNYKDERLKTLSMRGNGNYGYVDTIEEARRLLVEGLTGTLFAIAKDVKIQVDFNPSRVAAYRLLGYENRKLRDEDFHNDKIDAGEIGAGHTVTALYEIVPVGGTVPSKVDESRYGDRELTSPPLSGEHDEELMFVKLRYKQPDGDKSSLLEYPVVYDKDAELSGDAKFAAAVALYGMLLRQSRYSGAGDFDTVLELASPNVKDDPYRKEFVELVRKSKELR